jgi:hypothetical protein
MKLALAAGCALIAFSFCVTAAPAEAAKKKKGYSRVTTQRVVATQRPRTRITVRRRSFLDPGTEVLPGEDHSTDYVYPAGYSPTGVIDNTVFSHRSPLPGYFDLGGRNNPSPY